MRERRKDERRNRIIAAAETLIRITGTTDFSMQDLAKQAGLSTPTSYNLIGSKAAVLYLLLNRYQDRVDYAQLSKVKSKNPFIHVLKAADAAVNVYVADAQFIRPLMRFLIGAVEPDHRAGFMNRGFKYWYLAFTPLYKSELIDEIEITLLSHQFVIYFTGVIDFWVQGEISDEQFKLTARHGTAMCLSSIAEGEARIQMRAEIKKIENRIKVPYTVL